MEEGFLHALYPMDLHVWLESGADVAQATQIGAFSQQHMHVTVAPTPMASGY